MVSLYMYMTSLSADKQKKKGELNHIECDTHN